MPGFSASVRTDGTMFTQRASRMMNDAAEDAEEAVAEYAYDQVQDRLGVVLKHPTGYYQSKVRYHQVGNRWQVDDAGVVYGPWLEDGKNPRSTRFKGYQTFRRVAQAVNRRAPSITERIFAPVLRRL